MVNKLAIRMMNASQLKENVYYSPKLNSAMTVGSIIIIGIWALTLHVEQREAIIAHERGHIALRHSLKRILHCYLHLFSSHLRSFYHNQEFQADAWAANNGHWKGLIAYLTRVNLKETSAHPSSEARVKKLI